MDIRAAVGLKPTLLGLVVFLLLGGFSYKLHIYNTFLAQTQRSQSDGHEICTPGLRSTNDRGLPCLKSVLQDVFSALLLSSATTRFCTHLGRRELRVGGASGLFVELPHRPGVSPSHLLQVFPAHPYFQVSGGVYERVQQEVVPDRRPLSPRLVDDMVRATKSIMRRKPGKAPSRREI